MAKKTKKSRRDAFGNLLQKGEYYRNTGRYEFSYNDVDGKKVTIYERDLDALRKKEEQIEHDLYDGIIARTAKDTLNDMFKLDMDLKTDLRPTTRNNYEKMWEHNVADSLGKKAVKDIKPSMVKAFYVGLQKNGLKKNSIKLLHIMILSAFDLALDDDLIRKNPAKGCIKDLKDDSHEKTPLNEKQIENLIAFMNTDYQGFKQHIPFLIIAIQTGMRCGELTGLRWCDIDLKERTITVDHQLLYKNFDGKGCKFRIETTKTKAGQRTIPMTSQVHDAFIQIRLNNMALGKRCNFEVCDDESNVYSDFIFVSKNGKPLATNAVNAFLLHIEEAYNKLHEEEIPHLSAHVLRHTACTLISMKQTDVKALQYFMGHADVATTMNVYNHSSFERTQDAMKKIDNLIAINM